MKVEQIVFRVHETIRSTAEMMLHHYIKNRFGISSTYTTPSWSYEDRDTLRAVTCVRHCND